MMQILRLRSRDCHYFKITVNRAWKADLFYQKEVI